MQKPGRNAPCPCGSGKKFKNCHLGREDDIFVDGMGEVSVEMSARITSLNPVGYGRSREMVDALDIKKLTGSDAGIRFIDLGEYNELNLFGRRPSGKGKEATGGVVVNVLKTGKSDPNNVYVAISPGIGDGTLAHQLAHALNHLGGSRLMPGIARPLSLDLGIPVEHLEHPHEFCHWLTYLQKKFNVRLDADDTIICFLYENGMLVKEADIEKQDRLILKLQSDRILKFLSERSAEIDSLICELPGYIGSRVGRDEA
ncbi:MAG: SEC-C domain-containing protein [Thermodesulfobacteriota bacterium]|nr:SEC-C domain-containing protein [Thermodesulfobacteriota bacterium]